MADSVQEKMQDQPLDEADIARLHGATAAIDEAPAGAGFIVRIRFATPDRPAPQEPGETP